MPERWHATLIMWAVVLIAYIQNLWGIRLLPMLEVFAGFMHVFTFLAVFLVMLIMGRNASAEFVFTGFINQTGWESNGVAWFIGLLPAIWTLVGMLKDGNLRIQK
jgi:choline transport protein